MRLNSVHVSQVRPWHILKISPENIARDAIYGAYGYQKTYNIITTCSCPRQKLEPNITRLEETIRRVVRIYYRYRLQQNRTY